MTAARMIGSLLGAFGGRALGGMIGGPAGRMIGSLAGSMLAGRAAGGGLGGGGLGSVLGGLVGGDDDEATIAEDEAALLIKAMCNAAKADGHVDEAEIEAIIGRVGDLDAQDEAFLRSELESPMDTDSLVASTPAGLEADVYTASLLAVEVDTADEVGYMSELADKLGVDEDTRQQIHEALGVGY